jgi:hypothetical protein
MSTPSSISNGEIRGLQIIAGALIQGVVLFSIICIVIVGGIPGNARFDQPLSLIGAGGAALLFVLHFVVPKQMVQLAVRSTQPTDESDWLGVYRGREIIGRALLEGAGFFNNIAFLVDKNWWSLAVVGFLVFWMLITFPTRTRVEQWIETQRMQSDANS